MRYAELLNYEIKPFPVLCEIDTFRRRAEDLYACIFQLFCNIERGLAPELYDGAYWFFFFINAQHVFHGKRFKIEFIGGIVIGRDSFRVAVYHDGFIPFIPQGECRMDTRIIKFDTLPYPVRAAAKNHDLLPVTDLHLVRGIVG